MESGRLEGYLKLTLKKGEPMDIMQLWDFKTCGIIWRELSGSIIQMSGTSSLVYGDSKAGYFRKKAC